MKMPAYFLPELISIVLIAAIACGGAEFAPVSTVATNVVDTPAVPHSAGADSVTKSKRACLHISTIGDTIQVNRASPQETAIYSVTVTFTNASTINHHNWVLVQPGAKGAVAAAGVEAGEANSWVKPDDDRVIAHTKLLGPGESEEIKFTGQIVGIYQFVCTFPGHSTTMFGEFKFLQPGQR
jgi:azurin